MSAHDLSDATRLSDPTLVVCDAAGRILAVSANAPKEIIACSPVGHQHFAEVFGETSTITRWLTNHFGQARRAGDYFVEQQVENGNRMLQLRLESLTCDQELYGFALTLKPPSENNGEPLEEGDERQTVEKMLAGINSLIDYFAKIRRGETQ